MKYVFPCVMLIGGIGLMAVGEALVGVILAIYAAMTYSDVLELDREDKE